MCYCQDQEPFLHAANVAQFVECLPEKPRVLPKSQYKWGVLSGHLNGIQVLEGCEQEQQKFKVIFPYIGNPRLARVYETL